MKKILIVNLNHVYIKTINSTIFIHNFIFKDAEHTFRKIKLLKSVNLVQIIE